MKEYEINVQDIQLNYWHSHSQQTGLIPEVPDPHKSCKKISLSSPPLLPLQWISHSCKECPLTKPVNWIIAHNYGKPKCIFTKPTFSWKGKHFELDIVWYNVLLDKNPLAKIADLGIIFSWYHL